MKTESNVNAELNDLIISRILRAPRDKLWRAWTEPDLLKEWWCPKPWTTEVKAFDLRPGGAFHTLMKGPDGGSSDNPGSFANASAEAYRADVSLGLGDLLSGNKGRVTLYTQHLDAGYSAPGFDALTATQYYGGTFKLPIGDSWTLSAKADQKAQDQGLHTTAEELDVGYKLTKNGVTSIFHRNPNDAGFGNMRLYGECRVSADHSHDNPVWTEVTQLG